MTKAICLWVSLFIDPPTRLIGDEHFFERPFEVSEGKCGLGKH
jgi:hypothetical protein